MKALLLTACGAGQFMNIDVIREEITIPLKEGFILVQEDGKAKEGRSRTFYYYATIEDPKHFDRLAIYKEKL